MQQGSQNGTLIVAGSSNNGSNKCTIIVSHKKYEYFFSRNISYDLKWIKF